MNLKNKSKHIKIFAGIALCALLLIVGLCIKLLLTPPKPYFEGEAHLYYLSLLEKGFPEDYAKELTELHLLHPDWQFEPLLISQTNNSYTWDYVIDQETKEPETNLVPDGKTYRKYQKASNIKLYDSGYRQASVKAVEYFMDPRNFLNETDIFQFYDLSCHTESSIEQVKAVLEGTFMESEKLENNLSYAEYLMQIGKELDLNPVYLATKIRQEQGSDGASPIISGKCGDRLADYYKNQTKENASGKQVLPPSSGYTEEELLALNGYYNLFNVKASGNGLFQIYYNAMNRAAEGSPEMASVWGGDPAWNTRWKSIWGGAFLIKTNYVDRYQSTLYLQKYNVDGRAADRNFWGQYMQSISGAMTESRTLYSAFASVGALDSPCTFLIPIYENMPKKVCADPADGRCTILAQATERYDYRVKLTSPSRLYAKNHPIYQTEETTRGGAVRVSGSVSHSYGVKELQYRIDNGEWITLDTTENFDITVSDQYIPNAVHILTVRGVANYDHDVSGQKQNQYFLCAVYYIHITD